MSYSASDFAEFVECSAQAHLGVIQQDDGLSKSAMRIHKAIYAMKQEHAAMLAALRAARPALADWMEIAEEHDQRDSDAKALRMVDRAIAKAEKRRRAG